MAKQVRLTRPELKAQRDALARFEHYLPMLKLKQQQLQLTVLAIAAERRRAQQALEDARTRLAAYQDILRDRAGLDLRGLATPDEVRTGRRNIAGVTIPTFDAVTFPPARYSLFATPPWVDRALADLRLVSRRRAELEVINHQHRLLHRELVKVIQRVNLFEKIKIPEAREAIRRIRIHLGDEMTAAVGRAKIAKGKLVAEEATAYARRAPATDHPREEGVSPP
ncbi:MAG: V-type ATP synthase subunit D [Planctomycetota bacterium]|nr:V-type ATP synthase subunit D [Planctomycetota bacterium]